ncbi:tellurite resistance TerB family protein [Anatilimnocola floriformis]|uniref:tellurite resistance TerB family protein n=1 Tax=Anatilimnocola floriformis TaxID=2948575 RepID=UPI0020C4948A|nr:tellurite resistance TerB family protein [Anatilimnocola floriformis]
MGMFDDLLGNFGTPQAFGPQEGFAGVLLSTAAHDGHLADEEMSAMFNTLNRMKLYQHMPEQRFKSMIDRLVGVLKRNGPEELMRQSVSVVPPELRETVFASATDMILSDGIVEQSERELMQELMIKLQIDSNRAKTIVQVMVIKNKG